MCSIIKLRLKMYGIICIGILLIYLCIAGCCYMFDKYTENKLLNRYGDIYTSYIDTMYEINNINTDDYNKISYNDILQEYEVLCSVLCNIDNISEESYITTVEFYNELHSIGDDDINEFLVKIDKNNSYLFSDVWYIDICNYVDENVFDKYI